jgi:hypothetical protein
MPTPNSQDKRALHRIRYAPDQESEMDALIAYRESIIASEREAAANRANKTYAERNRLAIAFAMMIIRSGGKAGVGVDPGDEREDYWHTVVYALLPTGQTVSWHMAPEAEELAKRLLPLWSEPWDGTYLARDPEWPAILDGQSSNPKRDALGPSASVNYSPGYETCPICGNAHRSSACPQPVAPLQEARDRATKADTYLAEAERAAWINGGYISASNLLHLVTEARAALAAEGKA